MVGSWPKWVSAPGDPGWPSFLLTRVLCTGWGGQGAAWRARQSQCWHHAPHLFLWVSLCPTQPWVGPTAPSSLCGFLVLSGRGLQRLPWAAGRKPGWGHWWWVESSGGWL